MVKQIENLTWRSFGGCLEGEQITNKGEAV